MQISKIDHVGIILNDLSAIVADIEAIVGKLNKKGQEIFGEIQNHEDSYQLRYVRGPEGIILELAERIACSSRAGERSSPLGHYRLHALSVKSK